MSAALLLFAMTADRKPAPAAVAPHSIRLEAISLLATRLSGELERAFAARHALVVGAFVQATGWLVSVGDAMACAGALVGYRVYVRPDRTGFFGGPSFMFGRYYTAKTIRIGDVLAGDLSTKDGGCFTSLAPAFDAGYAVHVGNGGLVALAVGAQYNFTARREMSNVASWFAGNGLRPRVMLQVGATF